MASEGAAADSETAPEPGDAPAFDTSVAHVARVYNYWLGGKDNFAADRAAAEQAMAAFPDIVHSARANRAFLRRAVTYLAGTAGIRQFLDIGTGIPSANNTHEVAQSVAADCRIVYVDNDPVVLAHARALLTSTAEGATDYIDADLRNADRILAKAGGDARLLPAGGDHADGDPAAPQRRPRSVRSRGAAHGSGAIGQLPRPVASGRDIHAAEMAAMANRLNAMMAEKVTFRSQAEVAPFFAGLELIEPGMTNVPDWRPETDEEASSPAALWAGVARKP